jgi:hypothetical protein
MKTILLVAGMALVSVSARAHPGSNHLTCTSRKGAKQVVKVELERANAPGLAPPSYTITVDGVAHAFTTDDNLKTLGSTMHDSPLGVIIVSGDNSDDSSATAYGGFSITAIPRTVKAYDHEGKRVAWSIDDEANSCHDVAGKALFRASFRGRINDGTAAPTLHAQVLDCELDYSSGMAC